MWTANYIFSQICAIIGIIFLGITCIGKNKKVRTLMCLLMFASCGIHYLFLFAYAGVLINVVNIVSIVWCFANHVRNKRKDFTFLIIVLILLSLACAMVNNWTSVCALFAGIIFTIVLWIDNLIISKWFIIPIDILLIIYDIANKSIVMLILEGILLILGIINLIKKYRVDKNSNKRSVDDYKCKENFSIINQMFDYRINAKDYKFENEKNSNDFTKTECDDNFIPNDKTSLINKQEIKDEKPKEKNKKIKAIVFDFDGILTKEKLSSWQNLWNMFGYSTKEKSLNNLLQDKFSKGEITYQDWCNITCKAFKNKGCTRSDLYNLASKVKLINGFNVAIERLLERGYELHIVSDSITQVIYTALKENSKYFKSINANTFLFDEKGYLSKILGTNSDFDGNVKCITDLVKANNYKVNEILYVGNSKNNELASKTGYKTISSSYFYKTKNPSNNTDDTIGISDLVDYLDTYEEIDEDLIEQYEISLPLKNE